MNRHRGYAGGGAARPAFYEGVKRLLAPEQPPAAHAPKPSPPADQPPAPEQAPPPQASPPYRRPSWERAALAWAARERPELAAAVLEAEERARLAWAWEPWAEEEAWAEWELARRELRRAWEGAAGRAVGGREARARDALSGEAQPQVRAPEGQGLENVPEQPPEEPPAAGDEAEERELSFAKAEALFGGFEQVWELTDAQAAALNRLFATKGPVLVRTEAGWFGAGEWGERLARVDGVAALQRGGVPGRLVAGALREKRCRNGGKGRVAKTDYS